MNLLYGLLYGIPLSAVQKIQIILQMYRVNINAITEDKAIEIISAYREEIRPYLSVYEMEILDRAI